MKKSKLFSEESGRKLLEPDEPDYHCAANGCTLRATITDSTTGPFRHGRCRYHDSLEPSKWPKLTEMIRSGPFVKETAEIWLKDLGLSWVDGR